MCCIGVVCNEYVSQLLLLYSSRTAYYGIFDGHAGPKASQFAADNLHKNIVSRFPKGSSGCVDIYI